MAVAGTIIMVGMVEANGFGVPFRLCMLKVRSNVITEGITTDATIARLLFLIFVARYSQLFIKVPPKIKVYIPCFNEAVNEPAISLVEK